MGELTSLTEAELAELERAADHPPYEPDFVAVRRLIAELRALREAARAVEGILSRGERVTVIEYRALRNLLPAKQPA